MYNLLLVDDEVNVVNGLAFDIDWSDIGIGDIYRANSAQQALSHMEANRIDVVITDIRMPEMDGLELTAYIRKQWPFAKVIIISGYDEFEYAQESVNLGVFRYISKPLRYEDIKETVKEALEEIHKELTHHKVLEDARNSLNEILPLLRERYLNAWIIQGRMSPHKQPEKFEACRFGLKADSVALLILIRMDHPGDRQETTEVYDIAIIRLVREILLNQDQMIPFKDAEDHHGVIIYGENEAEVEAIRRYVDGMAETFLSSAKLTLGCTLSIFWSDIIPSLDDLHEAYNMVLDNLHRSISYGDGIIMGTGKEYPRRQEDSVNHLYDYPSFSYFVESRQKEKAIECIEKTFSEMESKGSIVFENLLEIYHAVSGVLLKESQKLKGVRIKDWAGESYKVFSSFEKIKSIQELRDWCIEMTTRLIHYTIASEKTQTNHLVDKAKLFINEKLHEDVSLKEIASALFIHPNYLSRLFKQETGMSITEYVTDLRIEEAKALLKESGIKAYEVAERLGYLSYAHFNRTFKAKLGVTPKEYQSQF